MYVRVLAYRYDMFGYPAGTERGLARSQLEAWSGLDKKTAPASVVSFSLLRHLSWRSDSNLLLLDATA